jgi:hypothetical protein
MYVKNPFQAFDPTSGLPIQIPVPFIADARGAGDLVANVASAFGFQPCDGCQQRQQLLNQNFQVVPFGTWWRGGL